MADSVIVRTFPASDAALQRAARRGVAEAEGATQEELAAKVRQALVSAGYAAVEVRFRETLADVTGGSEPLLYVYRDGRAGHRNARRDRWYATLGSARETIELVTRTWRDSRSLFEAPRRRRGSHEANPEALRTDASRSDSEPGETPPDARARAPGGQNDVPSRGDEQTPERRHD